MRVTTSFFNKEKWTLYNQHNRLTNHLDVKHLYHKRDQCHVLNPIEDKSEEAAQTYFEKSSTKSDELLLDLRHASLLKGLFIRVTKWDASSFVRAPIVNQIL